MSELSKILERIGVKKPAEPGRPIAPPVLEVKLYPVVLRVGGVLLEFDRTKSHPFAELQALIDKKEAKGKGITLNAWGFVDPAGKHVWAEWVRPVTPKEPAAGSDTPS